VDFLFQEGIREEDFLCQEGIRKEDFLSRGRMVVEDFLCQVVKEVDYNNLFRKLSLQSRIIN